MRIIRAEAKTAGKGDAQIDLHFQRRGSTVNYVRIGSFTLISGYIKWTYDEDLSPYWKGKVPEYLEDWFSRCGEIVEFGNNLFSHDVRKLVDILLVEALPKLWAGTWLVMSDEHANKSRLLRQVLKNASLNSVGKASINLINLENSSENKEHIGKELSDNYRDKIQDLIEEIGSLDTSMDPVKYEKKKGVISNAFSSVVAESDSIQDSLSVTFGDDFYEALAAMSQLL
jgi:hypothetical protein